MLTLNTYKNLSPSLRQRLNLESHRGQGPFGPQAICHMCVCRDIVWAPGHQWLLIQADHCWFVPGSFHSVGTQRPLCCVCRQREVPFHCLHARPRHGSIKATCCWDSQHKYSLPEILSRKQSLSFLYPPKVKSHHFPIHFLLHFCLWEEGYFWVTVLSGSFYYASSPLHFP